MYQIPSCIRSVADVECGHPAMPGRSHLAGSPTTVVLMAPPAPGPRTLTQMRRHWDDAMVTSLLSARPDLASPAPDGYSQVASRATTRHSVGTALDDLNAVELWVAERLAAHGTATSTQDLVDELQAEQPKLSTDVLS